MKPVPIFTGHIESGFFRLDNAGTFATFLRTLEGKRIELTIRRERLGRSLQQNRYYWGVVVSLIADHCGYEPEEMHEALKLKFLSDMVEDEHGLVRVGSTTKLSTEGFIDYINRIVRWAAQDLQCLIPDPKSIET